MKKQKIKTLKNRINKELKNELFKSYYEEEGVNVKIALEIMKLRRKHHLTQKDLAKKLNIPQQAISRLEQPNYSGYTLKTLMKLANIFNKKLLIKFK